MTAQSLHVLTSICMPKEGKAQGHCAPSCVSSWSLHISAPTPWVPVASVPGQGHACWLCAAHTSCCHSGYTRLSRETLVQLTLSCYLRRDILVAKVSKQRHPSFHPDVHVWVRALLINDSLLPQLWSIETFLLPCSCNIRSSFIIILLFVVSLIPKGAGEI